MTVVGAGRLKKGETVLIHGAAGGCGHFAVQIAKAVGATVIATASESTIDFVKELGADHVINYKTQNFVEETNKITNGRGVDLVYDTVGGETVSKSIGCTAPFGRIVSIVSIAGDINGGIGKNLTINLLFSPRNRETLLALKDLVDQGKLKVHIHKTFPLNQVADAHRMIEAGGTHGKIVLIVD